MSKSTIFSKDKLSIFIAFIIIGVFGLFLGMNSDKLQAAVKGKIAAKKNQGAQENLQALADEVLPKEGFTLPVSWGDLGPRMVKLGVIDLGKLKEAVDPTPGQLAILTGKTDE